MITNLTYGVRTSQELPNQLILQTGHRNAAAKSCTLNSSWNQKVSIWLAAQTLSISQNLVSTWHGAPPKQTKLWTGPLKQPPNKLILHSKPKLQTKILAQHSTEGNSPQLKPKKKTVRRRVQTYVRASFSEDCSNASLHPSEKEDCKITCEHHSIVSL